jgi:putative oxygen-independent coproporphyrinogen III oxidase
VSARQLAIYVHWPYCAAICPYCDFNVYKARGRDRAPLVSAILSDLAYWRDQTGPRTLSSIFFGGGTPSLMDPRDVAAIIEHCANLWGLEQNIEISLEANPTDAEAARFADLRAAGIERLSLGIQSFDDAGLKQLGRLHSGEEGASGAKLARALFPRLSLDLIYARPEQSLAQWESELIKGLSIEADHISPYQLTIESGTAFDRAVKRKRLVMPTNDLAAEFYNLTNERLEAAGFESYEVSNHARGRGFRSRHNQVYWTSQDWIGVGPGAHGRVGWGQGGRRATKAALRPEAYIASVKACAHGLIEDEILSDDHVRDEFYLMGLRLSDGVQIDQAPGAPLPPTSVSRFVNAGFMWKTQSHIGLTPKGRIVADTLIMQLLTT